MVFVGRNRELEELKHRFDEAVEGQSRIVMLVGQPGIGKTRLAQELEAYARTRNARVLWGRAPEGGGAPEHWLFTQVLRRFLDEVDETHGAPPARRRRGPARAHRPRDPRAAAHRGREWRRVRAAGGGAHLHPPPRRGAPAAARARRPALGGPGLARAAAARQPRDMARAKVCILGTYRDTELEPHAPALGRAGHAQPRGELPPHRRARARPRAGERVHRAHGGLRAVARAARPLHARDRRQPVLPQRDRGAHARGAAR